MKRGGIASELVVVVALGITTACLLGRVVESRSSGVYSFPNPNSKDSVEVDYTTFDTCRKHAAALTDFGGVGDGKTSNTEAFKAAIDHLSQLASDGGALLLVPPGKWLTGSFNLTSHFTLFLHKDAVILASQVYYIYIHTQAHI